MLTLCDIALPCLLKAVANSLEGNWRKNNLKRVVINKLYY
jgi:hypothetical protein